MPFNQINEIEAVRKTVQEIQPYFHGESVIIRKNNQRVNVSRNYREKFRKILEGRF